MNRKAVKVREFLPQDPIFLSFMVEYWFCFECGVVFGGVAFGY
jgi:hypothetical protein